MKKEVHEKCFAFLVHPPEPKDVAKKYPIVKFIPEFILKQLLKIAPPLFGSKITNFQLPTGQEIPGYIVICTLTAEQIMANPDLGKKKVLDCVRYAEKLGAKYIGLGAFTSIATYGGEYLTDKVKINLTTGNAYAAALAIENLEKTAGLIEKNIADSTVAVIGAAGSVGSACSKIIASMVKKVILIDKREDELKDLVSLIKSRGRNVESYLKIENQINADFIITATSASDGIIKSEHLKPGTIVIDCAQPHNVAAEVVKTRDDVLVIHSGIAALPGINLNMNVGLPPEEVYACLGEALIMVFRNWQGNYSLGKVKEEHVREILEFAPKLNLSVASFRNLNGSVIEEDFKRIKNLK